MPGNRIFRRFSVEPTVCPGAEPQPVKCIQLEFKIKCSGAGETKHIHCVRSATLFFNQFFTFELPTQQFIIGSRDSDRITPFQPEFVQLEFQKLLLFPLISIEPSRSNGVAFHFVSLRETAKFLLENFPLNLFQFAKLNEFFGFPVVPVQF